jgi:FMN phosphatase YigB (HAD superfamily)
MNAVTARDSIIGCLKGVATGDAIGKQTEGLSRADVLRWYPQGVRGFKGPPGSTIPRYIGNAKREWQMGETTDDTERTIAVGRAILLARASYRPSGVSLDQVLERATEVADRRDHLHVETAWRALTRLIHDFLGVRFDASMPRLEMGFWKASVQTRPMPGARHALEQCRQRDLLIAVLSNSSFGEPVIRYELAKHGLADHLAFIMVSADYAVRRPNVLLFETASARLALAPKDIWFIGDRLDTDIAGAKRAGMTAAWFNPSQEHNVSEVADLIVRDWDAVIQHLQLESWPERTARQDTTRPDDAAALCDSGR